MDDLRQRAMALFEVGVRAADPGVCVAQAMGDVLGDGPGPGGRWHVIALGKAAPVMVRAALEALPETARTLVVTTAGHAEAADRLPRSEVIIGDHPVPGAGSLAAGAAILRWLGEMSPEDRCLALISGGGSALAVAPVDGMSLQDKAEVNRLLLGAGADIGQMNLIRQHLSRLKGGGWLRHSQAPITALMLSDVPGDDLRVIASGPTVAPIGRRQDAVDLARELGIWERLPAAAVTALMREDEASPPIPEARNRLVGSNALSLEAMVREGARRGSFTLEGDVTGMAPLLADALCAAAPGEAVVFGGETVVQLRGAGLGGRNQELALRVAVEMERRDIAGDWLCLCAGTDGRDGPTDAAGGIVGPGVLDAIRAAGIDPVEALARNDSNAALAAGSALVVIGETGTNVADLAVLIRAEK